MKENKSAPLLITGAGGFIGKNLVARLTALGYTDLMLYEKDTDPALLCKYAARCTFAFHLAGINRPQDPREFYTGNADLTRRLLDCLISAGNPCPVLVTSSTQAALENDYGKSKREAEEAIFEYGRKTGARVCCYRLPGVFGKWCRPGYNSVVATFCHNIASGEDIEVRDPQAPLALVYIDDVIDSFLLALAGEEERPCEFCAVSPVHHTSLGGLAETLYRFQSGRRALQLPNFSDPLEKKLYSTFLSYLPPDDFSYPLKMNVDDRGSFTEFLRTPERGQVSVNISKPGVIKGNHWHDTKNEKFLVVKGDGVIRFRKWDEETVYEYRVSGEKLEVVDIPTGYTHNIENVGEGEMVTVMWANEPFDPARPDTYFLKV